MPRNPRCDRRTYLRTAGAVLASASALGTVRASADVRTSADARAPEITEREEYTEVAVPEGGLWRHELGDDETLSNYLIDVSASGANAQILATGSNWTIRNVGFRGVIDAGREFPQKHVIPSVDAGGRGTIERVYLGDGSTAGRQGGVWVHRDHAGRLTVRDCTVCGWADNGIYGSGPAKPGGGGGTVTIDGCFARNNNTASYRIGTRGSSVRNSVVHIDGGIPAKRGVRTGRGVWVWGDETTDGVDRYEVSNVDVLVESDGGTWAVDDAPSISSDAVVEFRNSSWRGGSGLADGVDPTNVDHQPDVTPPDGAPTTAEEAARGE